MRTCRNTAGKSGWWRCGEKHAIRGSPSSKIPIFLYIHIPIYPNLAHGKAEASLVHGILGSDLTLLSNRKQAIIGRITTCVSFPGCQPATISICRASFASNGDTSIIIYFPFFLPPSV